MKTRTRLVSNSSSSSFVVIDYNSITKPPKQDPLVVDEDFGETEFGWGPGKVWGVGARVIFAYLQTQYAENKDWLKMLETVLKKYYQTNHIVWGVTTDWREKEKDQGHIDHQSAASEGENTQMFDTERDLEHFLFGSKSFIMLDNDNH